MSIRCLEALEAHSLDPETLDRSEVRVRMKESLNRIARLRHGELGPEEAAEVEREVAAIERRMAQRAGGRVAASGPLPRKKS